jgi:hypothetical protein
VDGGGVTADLDLLREIEAADLSPMQGFERHVAYTLLQFAKALGCCDECVAKFTAEAKP